MEKRETLHGIVVMLETAQQDVFLYIDGYLRIDLIGRITNTLQVYNTDY